jgi:PAS domain S-box-containing protein
MSNLSRCLVSEGMKSEKFKAPLIYITIGIVWIVLSEKVVFLAMSASSSMAAGALNIGGGILFVLGTGAALYILLERERKKIARNEKQYRNLYEGNPYPIWFYDPVTFRFIDVNDAAVDRYGYSREEFLTMSIFDIRPSDDYDKVMTSFLLIGEESHESGTWRHLKKDGTLMYVNISAHKTQFQDRNVIMAVIRDNTEKYIYEQQISRTGEILNKISNPVIISDAKGNISWINPAFTKVTGYTSFEITGMNHINTLFCSQTDPLVVTRLLDAVSRNEAFSADLLNYDKFNREYWVSLNLYPIFDPDGALECYVSVQNDITEHKEKEAVIGVQNEKLKAVSWLNSHQIRKPVASILALTQLMRSSEDETEKEEILKMLHHCAIELDEIILEINAEASGRISA